MRVLIHGGMQKAGSSAVQDYLYSSRDALRDAGVIYPDLGHREHWLVTAAFVSQPERYHHVRRRFRGNDVSGAVAKVREDIAGLIRTAGPADTLLLSHEDLSVRRTLGQLVAFVADASASSTETIFVAYVRHPVSMYPSSIQQALKTHRDRNFLPSSWIAPHIKRVQAFRHSLPARTLLRPFAPPGSPEWDVIEDFRTLCHSVIGREMPMPTSADGINSSMSWEACALLEHARSAGSEVSRSKGLLGVIRRFDGRRKGKKLSLPSGWATDIARTNADQWNEILPQLDCTEDVRSALAIPPGAPTRAYQEVEVRRWLVSGLDDDYCRELASACSSGDEPHLRQPTLAEWLWRDVIGQVDAIKAAT